MPRIPGRSAKPCQGPPATLARFSQARAVGRSLGKALPREAGRVARPCLWQCLATRPAALGKALPNDDRPLLARLCQATGRRWQGLAKRPVALGRAPNVPGLARHPLLAMGELVQYPQLFWLKSESPAALVVVGSLLDVRRLHYFIHLFSIPPCARLPPVPGFDVSSW